MQNSTLATEKDRNLVLDYRILRSKGKILEEILQSQRLLLFSHWWFMMTISSRFVTTPQVNCLAHNTELGHNGEKKHTAASWVEPDKNLKMFWYFWVLKKQAQSGFPNNKCFPGSPGWIYTSVVIFQLPFFTVQLTLSYLCWNGILKRPKEVWICKLHCSDDLP